MTTSDKPGRQDPLLRPGAVATILGGGAAIAILDISNAMLFWGLARGTNPLVILQSVAAGLLGRDALEGGTATAILGSFLHLFNSVSIAAVFYFAARLLPIVLTRPFLTGPAYGALVYLVMNHIVVPLSQARHVRFMLAWFIANFVGHLLLVGLPVAIIARWSALQNQRNASHRVLS